MTWSSAAVPCQMSVVPKLARSTLATGKAALNTARATASMHSCRSVTRSLQCAVAIRQISLSLPVSVA